MRIARYVDPADGAPRIGLVEDEAIVPLPDAADAVAVLTDPGAHRRAADAARLPLAETELLCPHEPRAIWAVGLNFRCHAEEVELAVPAEPVLFHKAPRSIAPPYGAIRRPAVVEQLDFEAELGLVIGEGQRVAGYVVCNDVSARDYLHDRQFTRMKSPDTFCPFGPWITTVDEVPDPYALRMRTWVDGELRQDASTSDMIFTFDQVLGALTPLVTLGPGDLILTGTPAGVGLAARPPRFLAPGQTVRIEIERLGAIEHTIEDASTGGTR